MGDWLEGDSKTSQLVIRYLLGKTLEAAIYLSIFSTFQSKIKYTLGEVSTGNPGVSRYSLPSLCETLPYAALLYKSIIFL